MRSKDWQVEERKPCWSPECRVLPYVNDWNRLKIGGEEWNEEEWRGMKKEVQQPETSDWTFEETPEETPNQPQRHLQRHFHPREILIRLDWMQDRLDPSCHFFAQHNMARIATRSRPDRDRNCPGECMWDSKRLARRAGELEIFAAGDQQTASTCIKLLHISGWILDLGDLLVDPVGWSCWPWWMTDHGCWILAL